jgi:hypothetical protein
MSDASLGKMALVGVGARAKFFFLYLEESEPLKNRPAPQHCIKHDMFLQDPTPLSSINMADYGIDISDLIQFNGQSVEESGKPSLIVVGPGYSSLIGVQPLQNHHKNWH